MIEEQISEEARFCIRHNLTRAEYARARAKAEAIMEDQSRQYLELRKKYREQRAVLRAIGKEMEALKSLPGAVLERDAKDGLGAIGDSARGISKSDKDSSDGHWERQCGARTASGKRCTRKPYAGSQFCYLHGGFSPYSGDPTTRHHYRRMMALHAIIEANLGGLPPVEGGGSQ